ncbi:MAG: hypothetical protein N2316_06105, partial [Spirochaetes bacterium]|nr:hypothetical protein [Spirochaetota bacterium]
INSITGYDIYDYISEKNLDLATDAITEIISKLFNRQEVNCQLEFEQTSSLMLELSEIPIEEPPNDDHFQETIQSEEEKLMKKIESEASHIINGRIIVSPIKGKYIRDIAVGDKIKVLLHENDDIAKKVAISQKAITPEGELLPVKARIKAKIPLPQGGFVLYGVVAKNILARIVEEENVKIEIDITQQQSETNNTSTHLPLYIVVGLGFFFIILLIIILLIKL